jgi:hypothetical protein
MKIGLRRVVELIDRLRLKAMGNKPPKAQLFGGKAAVILPMR